MGRSVLDVSYLTLCLEAERVGAAVRALPEAWPWLERLGVDPAALPARMGTLARRAHEVWTMRCVAMAALAEARASARDEAEALHATTRAARPTLEGLARVHVETEGDVVSLLPLLRTRSVRVQGALDRARHLRDELLRADQSITRHEVGRALADAVVRHADVLADRWAVIHAAERTVRVRAQEAREMRVTLQKTLREIDLFWRAAHAMSDGAFLELDFPLARAEAAQREAAAARGEAPVEEAFPEVVEG